jgi:hypothetical protein
LIRQDEKIKKTGLIYLNNKQHNSPHGKFNSAKGADMLLNAPDVSVSTKGL